MEVWRPFSVDVLEDHLFELGAISGCLAGLLEMHQVDDGAFQAESKDLIL